MSLFLDWHHKSVLALTDKSNTAEEMSWEQVTQAAMSNGKIVYLERGCPRRPLIDMLNNDVKVGMIDGKAVKDLRDKLGVLKSHEADVAIIKQGVEDESLEVDFLTKDFIKQLAGRGNQRMYAYLTKVTTRMKNIHKAMEREFPESIAKEEIAKSKKCFVSHINKAKKEAKDRIVAEFAEEAKMWPIKGIKETTIGQILTIAPPKLFSHFRQYLKYCGYTGKCLDKKTGEEINPNKYSREAKTLFYLCTTLIIFKKSPKWYALYKKIKEERMEDAKVEAQYQIEKAKIKGKHFITKKSYVEKTTRNRISTLLCKDFFETFHKANLGK